MTLQLLHSEFPYIWGKFYFIFYQCGAKPKAIDDRCDRHLVGLARGECMRSVLWKKPHRLSRQRLLSWGRTTCPGRGCSAEAALPVPAEAAQLKPHRLPRQRLLSWSRTACHWQRLLSCSLLPTPAYGTYYAFNQRSFLKSQWNWASALVNPCCLSGYYIKFRLVSWTFLILHVLFLYSKYSCSLMERPLDQTWISYCLSMDVCTAQMKGRWESNLNVWFPFMYSQKWKCYFQNKILMFSLTVPTLIYMREINIFPGSVCLFCCWEICGPILEICI
jgi:hypothetical protein